MQQPQHLEIKGRTLFKFRNTNTQNGFITHPTTITITTNTTRIVSAPNAHNEQVVKGQN